MRGFTGGGFRSTTSISEKVSSFLKASAAPSTAFLEALKATNPGPLFEPESPRKIMRPGKTKIVYFKTKTFINSKSPK